MKINHGIGSIYRKIIKENEDKPWNWKYLSENIFRFDY